VAPRSRDHQWSGRAREAAPAPPGQTAKHQVSAELHAEKKKKKKVRHDFRI